MYTQGKTWLQISTFISHRYPNVFFNLGFAPFLNMCNRHDTATLVGLHVGTTQIPARVPQLHQGGHDPPGWVAFQNHHRFRQVTVCHDPQDVEWAGSCRPDKNHAPWRMEEGKECMFGCGTSVERHCLSFCLQHIITSYIKHSGITVKEAKISFLRTISSWPTFGCAFFEVKVRSHQHCLQDDGVSPDANRPLENRTSLHRDLSPLPSGHVTLKCRKAWSPPSRPHWSWSVIKRMVLLFVCTYVISVLSPV